MLFVGTPSNRSIYLSLTFAIAIHLGLIIYFQQNLFVNTATKKNSTIEIELAKQVVAVSQEGNSVPDNPVVKPAPAQKKPVTTQPKIVRPKVAPLFTDTDLTSERNKSTVLRTERQITTNNKSQTALSTISGTNISTIRADYLKNLAAWLERHKRYPMIARRRAQEGEIVVEFSIRADGSLLSHHFITLSPHVSLNKAVSRMLQKASPMPAVPRDLRRGHTSFNYTVPVIFKLAKTR